MAACLFVTSLTLKLQPGGPTGTQPVPAGVAGGAGSRPRSLPELLESVNLSGRKELNRTEQVALLDALMREGLLSLRRKGIKFLSKMVEFGGMDFGHAGTDGEVLDAGVLQLLEGKGCSNPREGYLAICTKIRNQAWAVNEWLAYHKLLGVEHVRIVEDNSTDNFYDVIEPWWPFASAQRAKPGAYGWKLCWDQLSPHYTWIAFIDMDEYLTPLREGCLHEVLKDYEQFGGLVVAYSLYNDAKQVGGCGGRVQWVGVGGAEFRQAGWGAGGLVLPLQRRQHVRTSDVRASEDVRGGRVGG